MTDVIRVYRDESGEWRWRKKAPNNETVADGSEGYTTKGKAVEAAWREAAGTDATVEVEE